MTTPVSPDSLPLLQQPLDRVLGPKTAKPFAPLGIVTVGDLLRHAPRRYMERGELQPLGDYPDGQDVSFLGRVDDVSLRRMQSKRGAILTATVTDGAVDMLLTFFGRGEGHLQGHLRKLRIGELGIFSGKVGHYRGKVQLTHPDYEMVDDPDELDSTIERRSKPIPMYPATSKLPTWKIATAVQTVLALLTPEDVPELLPATVRGPGGYLPAFEAIRALHVPESLDEAEWGRRTATFQEAFVLQALLVRRRRANLALRATPRPGRPDGLLAAFDSALPFALTRGQQAVGEELSHDLAGEVPMLRLLQGEVGSGKTVVALRAMLQVVDSGGQAALLAPTEVLAAQHHRSISRMLGDLALGGTLVAAAESTQVALLTASLPTTQRRLALAAAASGDAGIVIGTHALLSENVQFLDLGLVVVDEQHRFGVEQRDKLREQGTRVAHSLVMTATPIPRTIAMTVFGDLERSTLGEVPAGRAEVATFLIDWENEAWVERMWARCAEEVRGGGRVYVVCPRIDAHDDGTEDDGEPDEALLDAQGRPLTEKRPLSAVLDVVDQLRARPEFAATAEAPEIGIGMLHGRMSAEAKERVMTEFASGATPMIVATTVVEVGVDVPEATVMVILDADRFGVSQLHQLRGRIGRGERPGVCFAVSTHVGGEGPTAERLAAFAATRDGFRLAEHDLDLRREGDVLGAAQSGITSSLVSLRVLRDRDIIEQAHRDASALLEEDPDLEGMPGLRAELDRIETTRMGEFLERT
ncbi:MAG: ATP-dependent DNA helicase RecG [bacterium]|nr:ATP-dependent DNA helicase RecG [bacterium]